MITEIREMNSFEETIHMENMELKKKIECLEFEIKNYEFENEFLKLKNRRYREEIWNHEVKKA